MKFSYGFNPNNEYGLDIAPSMENYNTSLPKPKYEAYPRKAIQYDFGLFELFTVLMIIPFWIFVYKFFYLLVLPLIPVSVIVFELVREAAPLNKLFMLGGSFLAAYLFYRGLKCFLSFFSFWRGLLVFVGMYVVSAFLIYFLLSIYPENEVLMSVTLDLEKVIIFLNLLNVEYQSCISW